MNRVPERLETYKPSEDAFQILDTNAAAIWFVIVFLVGCLFQWMGLI